MQLFMIFSIKKIIDHMEIADISASPS